MSVGDTAGRLRFSPTPSYAAAHFMPHKSGDTSYKAYITDQ